MLGFNRTHHMIHVVGDTENREMREWTRALRAKYRNSSTFTKLDWDRLLGDCHGDGITKYETKKGDKRDETNKRDQKK